MIFSGSSAFSNTALMLALTISLKREKIPICITPGGRFSLQLMQASCQHACLLQWIDFHGLSFDAAARRCAAVGRFGQFHQIEAETCAEIAGLSAGHVGWR
jgi:hypothetical protein